MKERWLRCACPPYVPFRRVDKRSAVHHHPPLSLNSVTARSVWSSSA
jgi:hypothetical protein